MKRMIVLLFVFVLLIGLCACQMTATPDVTIPTQATTTPKQVPPTERPTEPTQAPSKAPTAPQSTSKAAKVSGAFTVTVRQILPDYLLDDSTPSVAVVTPFQSNLFALDVSYEIASQLEVGKTYVFSVKPVFTDYSVDMLQGLGTAALFELIPALEVADFRLADENEIGLNSHQLTIE
jgi:hypothetical protein